MAPVETDSDNNMSARKNLCIVFLHSDGGKLKSRMTHGMTGTDYSDCERRGPQQRAKQKRWKMRPNLRRPRPEYRAPRRLFVDINNPLILQHYFTIIYFYI